MSELGIIRECRKIVRELRGKIERLRSRHLNREDLKQDVCAVVDGYFRTDKPILLQRLRDEGLFQGIDSGMQDLLRFTHKRTVPSRYKATLLEIEDAWGNLEVRTIHRFGDMTGGEVPQFTLQEEAILRTLEQLCPQAALCYRQAWEDLNRSTRISWRGTAAELRESLREVLDKLAPDDEVQKMTGFKLEEGARGPTMKQKTRFILKSRRRSEAARATVEGAVEVVEDKVGALVRSVYNRSSISVHIEAMKPEVISVKRFVDTVLIELLEIV